MYTITKKKSLANSIYLMDVKAPRVAKNCYPGQFVIIKMDEKGERIPLTICDYDREEGTVTIVFQAIGSSTQLMAQYEEGEAFRDFTGPLGHRSELIDMPREELKKKNILFVAGGVGAAPVYPQVKWMKENGYDVDCIIGARNKELIILEDEMKAVAKNVYITTDDGTYGFHGNVNDCIKDLVNHQGKKYDLVIAIGPMIMMKFVCILTKELGIKTIVSMNPVMVDGTGMCGACRLTIGNEVKFACVDGPEFDGHLVNFDEAMKRLQMYKTAEGKKALRQKEGDTHHHKGCECHEE
ncbi:sulfide/dihydroorotate dehydrogenase-like FAD/NAD-binding protein [Mobilitalea sibirica]|uniref:Sulfide/dihydroorotate dehydrogenase-like FAD/NAD-binding protein n=1 Tax=Mobilitalea sibirica TaxID=1462919 RepID=A0A8J7H1C6_9FIRM|nr:sulfide/dihydroorotate dehydrogenase-like FAD/NAD-binding protein [Mobilitalea sibirica]MBH1940127.1 sulfide/dihydroorotate dehydrogenase-like FAD/NAD-binding protein [Mobilitalea sibirica]